MDILKYISNAPTIENLNFNSADASVLSDLAYLDIDKLTISTGLKISDIPEDMLSTVVSRMLLHSHYKKLYSTIPKSNRFGNFVISDIVKTSSNEFDAAFFGYTCRISDLIIVIFRGTDTSFAGWSETLAMSYETIIPAQESAKKYLQNIARKYSGDIIICGHSKGGNLAVYSYLEVDSKIRQRVKKVYDLDGPGFLEEYISSLSPDIDLSKITKYVPQKAIVGFLMNPISEIKTVNSKGFNIAQHAIANWKIKHNELEIVENSKLDDSYKSINNWINTYSPQEKKEIMSALIKILEYSELDNFDDFQIHALTSLRLISDKIKSNNSVNYKIVFDALDEIFGIRQNRLISGVLSRMFSE